MKWKDPIDKLPGSHKIIQLLYKYMVKANSKTTWKRQMTLWLLPRDTTFTSGERGQNILASEVATVGPDSKTYCLPSELNLSGHPFSHFWNGGNPALKRGC